MFKKCRNKSEMVVTFLAVLELIRLREIKIIQKEVFGEIEILRNKENILPKDDEEETPAETAPLAEPGSGQVDSIPAE